jgi:hypothetical protein
MYAPRCFAQLWHDLSVNAPRASGLRQALAQAGYEAVVDHIGLVTIARPPIGIRELERHLFSMGYHRQGQARDPARGVSAACWRGEQPHLPRIAIVELDPARLSAEAERLVVDALEAIPPQRVLAADMLWSGRLWPALSWHDYVRVMAEDQAIASVLALGLHPCHAALQLDRRGGLELDRVIEIGHAAGLELDRRELAGVAMVVTAADRMPVEFSGDRVHELPTASSVVVDPMPCATVLALRLPLAVGELAAAIGARRRGGRGD